MAQPHDPKSSETDRRTAAGRRWFHRPWRVVMGVVLIAAAVLAAVWFLAQGEYLSAWLSPANVFLWRVCTVAVSVLFLDAWFVLAGPASRRVRLTTVMVSVALIAGFFTLYRVQGFSGDMIFGFTYRWAPKPDERLPAARPASDGPGSIVVSAESSSDYPEFLGRGRHATVEGVKLATDWTARPPRPVWGPQPIGAGWSGFSVVGGFAFTQEQRGDDELVTCYDAKTGKLVWSHADRLRFNSVMGGDGPRATPTVDQGRLFTLGATGLLNCLDASSGDVIWQKDIVLENGAAIPDWGKSGSPLVLDKLVVVSAGGPDGKSLVAYDTQSGQLVWNGGSDKSSYSSPVLRTLAGTPQILIVNANSISAHDPADGKVLWTQDWPGHTPSVSQPVAVGDDRLFVSKGYGGGCQLWQIGHAPQGKWTVDTVWKNLNLKTKFTNVVVRDGCVFGLDEGILTCLDLADGSRRWKQGRYGHGQILLVGDVILVQADTGDVALVAATGAHYQELTRFTALQGKTWNNPVLSGPYLFVRNAEEAACYELPLAPGE